jgi:hypothetical protein
MRRTVRSSPTTARAVSAGNRWRFRNLAGAISCQSRARRFVVVRFEAEKGLDDPPGTETVLAGLGILGRSDW